MLARQIVIGIGIALLFPMLVYYGIATLSTPPQYADFNSRQAFVPPTASIEERQAFNDLRKRESDAWQAAQAGYAKTVISVMAPIGIAAMLTGYFVGISAIGTGLLVGGIISAAYGYQGYWNYLPEWMRFCSLLGGFLMLLFIGLKQFRPAAVSQTGGD